MSYKVHELSVEEIDDDLLNQWRALQGGNPDLGSPFFDVEYYRSVSAVRNDVRIAVIEEQNQVVGFFPYQRGKYNVGRPVGGCLSDFQGIICEQGKKWSFVELLKLCRLRAWDFDHLISSQAPSSAFRMAQADSPIIDLSNGFGRYLEIKKKQGSKRLGQFQRKKRKLEREVGPLQLDVYSQDDAAFQQMVEWKIEQCRQTGVQEFFTWGWTVDMLKDIWKKKTNDFSGMLTVLSVDGEYLAVHFGMRSENVCHWWFPTYNKRYGKYSPGALLLLELTNSMAEEGVSRVDLGKGEDSYKPSFATGVSQVLEGSVLMPSLYGVCRKASVNAKHSIKDSALYRSAKSCAKAILK